MPRISYFLGIIITMYYDDHAPPHFHVQYNKYRAIFDIRTMKMMEGDLPQRITALVLEWAALHRDELANAWDMCIAGQPPHKIAPLV